MIFYNTSSPDWLRYGYDTCITQKWPVKLSGYLEDRDHCLHKSYCQVQQESLNRLKYNCNTAGKMSGSGILLSRGQSDTIYGVHTDSGYQYKHGKMTRPCSGGARINSSRFKQLQHCTTELLQQRNLQH